MSISPLRTSVAAVDDAGRRVQERRAGMGMSVSALAKRAGVDRGSLAALEAGGSVRDTTLAAVEKALAELEHEMGMDLPSQVDSPRTEPHMIEIEVSGDFGVRVVVKGPIEDRAELEASALRLARNMRGDAHPEG